MNSDVSLVSLVKDTLKRKLGTQIKKFSDSYDGEAMKRYRRIEITAFRRRIIIVSGESAAAAPPNSSVCINDAYSSETIEAKSAEGRRILIEAVRLLEEKLSNQEPGEC
ncbi:MAG: hypothetical protein LH614_02885 [Pyrinomonadaceae bacterium]|nr:hypothetical protein [Pyrinomonadaceae bacterium]